MCTWRAEKRERPENTGLDALLDSSRNLLEGYRCVGQLTCFAWEMITAGMEDDCDQIATHLQTEKHCNNINISPILSLWYPSRVVNPMPDPDRM